MREKRQLAMAGVALVELAIVIPLILLLVFAIYEVGSNLSHMARINQVAYSAALRGAGMSDSGAPIEVATIAVQLYDASLKDPAIAIPYTTPSYDTNQRLVTLYFNEGLSGFKNPFFADLPVALSVTLPLLVNTDASDISDKFESPNPYYCPNGQECYSPPPTPTPGGCTICYNAQHQPVCCSPFPGGGDA